MAGAGHDGARPPAGREAAADASPVLPRQVDGERTLDRGRLDPACRSCRRRLVAMGTTTPSCAIGGRRAFRTSNGAARLPSQAVVVGGRLIEGEGQSFTLPRVFR